VADEGAKIRLMAIDWSGCRDAAGQRKHIWMADRRENGTVTLTNERTRVETVTQVIAAAGEGGRLIAGFDFAFAYPAWFSQQQGCEDGPQMWRLVAERGEAWLRECAHPFWGRPGKRCPPSHRGEHWLGFRATDRATGERVGRMPTSPFQIGGAGAVGTGSMRGMPLLLDLQQAGFAVWPFDAPRLPMALEIYPRIFTQRTRVNNAAERARRLDQPAYHDLPDEVLERARRSPDAFDALCALVGMTEHADELLRLPALEPAELRLEGAIWAPDGGYFRPVAEGRRARPQM
jgi:hypothetical protein